MSGISALYVCACTAIRIEKPKKDNGCAKGNLRLRVHFRKLRTECYTMVCMAVQQMNVLLCCVRHLFPITDPWPI